MFRKKITSFVAILAATVSLTGCGGSDTDQQEANSPNVTEASATSYGGHYKNRIDHTKQDLDDSASTEENLDDLYEGDI